MEPYQVECPHCGGEFTPTKLDITKIDEDEHGLLITVFMVAGIDDPGLQYSFRLPRTAKVEHVTLLDGVEHITESYEPKEWAPEEIRAAAANVLKERVEGRRQSPEAFETRYAAALGRIA